MATESSSASRPPDLNASLTALVNAVVKGMERDLEALGANPTEFAVLRSLLMSDDGAMTATALSRILPVDPPRVSRVVQSLHERGLLDRRRPPSDRRVVYLELTDAGRELAVRMAEVVNAGNERLMEGMAEPEKAGFFAAIGKMLLNWEKRQAEESASTVL